MDTVMFPSQQSRLLLSLLEERGASTTRLMQGTGLQACDLDKGDTWISYRQTMQIIDNAYGLTGHGPLGLEVGSKEDASTFGILGYAMQSCATVGEFLEVGERYQRTAQNLCDLWLEPRGAALSLAATTPFLVSPACYRFAIEVLFSGIIKLVRVLSGVDVYPTEIHCTYTGPVYRDDYEQVFNCPVYFDQSANRMVLDNQLLELGLLQANSYNADVGKKLCHDLLQKYSWEEDLAARVRNSILRTPGQFPDEAALAADLAISSRTMRRRLSALGTSYRGVLDQIRCDLAQQYLQNSSLSTERIGQLLGYTEAANFRRAFKRWLGLSPRDYRRKSAEEPLTITPKISRPAIPRQTI
jgi:AraC-like DNA-binding protein